MPGINKKKYLYLLTANLNSSLKTMSAGDHRKLIQVKKMKANRVMITLLVKSALMFTFPENREEIKMTSRRIFMIFQAPQ